MRITTKLGAAALLAGAVAVPALNANAVTHTANFTLQAAPVVASVASTANTDFGTITIPSAGESPTTKSAPDTAGVVEISNATDGATYTVTVANASCPDNAVLLTPTASYGSTTVDGGAAGDITFDSSTSTTLSMGGSLSVASSANAGASACTYDVTIAAAAAPAPAESDGG